MDLSQQIRILMLEDNLADAELIELSSSCQITRCLPLTDCLPLPSPGRSALMCRSYSSPAPWAKKSPLKR